VALFERKRGESEISTRHRQRQRKKGEDEKIEIGRIVRVGKDRKARLTHIRKENQSGG